MKARKLDWRRVRLLLGIPILVAIPLLWLGGCMWHERGLQPPVVPSIDECGVCEEDIGSSESVSAPLNPQAALTVSELVSSLRSRFGITWREATDTELRVLLRDRNERRLIEAVVRQDRLGQRITAFLAGGDWSRGRGGDREIDRQFLGSLGTDSALAALGALANAGGLYFLSAATTALSTMLTVAGGVNAILSFVNVVDGSYHMREVLVEFFRHRGNNKIPSQAFLDTYADYGPSINLILNVRALRALSESQKMLFGPHFFEVRYQAWRVATQESLRKNVKIYVLRMIGASQVGSLQVTIEPAGARNAGAQWRLTSGPDTGWKNSGVTVSNLPVGTYTVTFRDITGWTRPAGATVTINANQTITRSGTYARRRRR